MDYLESSGVMMEELKKFMKGINHDSGVSKNDITNSALRLLSGMPAARPAVLEYLSNLLLDIANNYTMLVSEGKSVDEANNAWVEQLGNIQLQITNLLRNAPVSLTLEICAWAVELLGQISSKYTDRLGVSKSSGLSELLQTWINSKVVLTLLFIITECFYDRPAESIKHMVAALLEASVKYTPYCDWVVAYTGSSCAGSLIGELLTHGQTEFAMLRQQKGGLLLTEEGPPSLVSLASVLSYIAQGHASVVVQSIADLFKASLTSSAGDCASALLFLLRLLSLSSSQLLNVVADEFVSLVTSDVLRQLHHVLTDNSFWKSEQEKESVLHLVVHLVTKMSTSCLPLIRLLLDIASPFPTNMEMDDSDAGMLERDDDTLTLPDLHQLPAVSSAAVQLLDRLVMDLRQGIRMKTSDAPIDIPLLRNLRSSLLELCELYASSEQRRLPWLSHLLVCLALYCGESVGVSILLHILSLCHHHSQVGFFVFIQTECSLRYPDVAQSTLKAIQETVQSYCTRPDLSQHEEITHLLSNLLYVIRWEQSPSGHAVMRQRLCQLLQTAPSLRLLSDLLSSTSETAILAMRLMHAIQLPAAHLDSGCVLHMSSNITAFFFTCLKLRDKRNLVEGCQMSQVLLQTLCHEHGAMRVVVRLLLEGALAKKNREAFGYKATCPEDMVPSVGETVELANVHIIHENKFTEGSSLSRARFTAVGGPAIRAPNGRLSAALSEIVDNCSLFIGLLSACCQDVGDVVFEDKRRYAMNAHTAKYVALLLVQLVTPDGMYNGIPWPDDESTKFTIERDVGIRKKFDENSVLWNILEYIAEAGANTMSYCSVLLRSVMASLLAHWETSRDKLAAHSPQHLRTTVMLLRCMAMGDLLPSLLAHTGHIVHLLPPYDVYLLLVNIWKYMKENPPLPQNNNAEKACGRQYVDVIHTVLHKNIDRLGPYYQLFFNLNGNPV